MEQKTKRICMSIFGVLVCGISVGFFKRAAFGVDPFQTLMSGLDALIPISFGTLYVIVNVLLLLFSLFADRHYIGIATFINLFLLGYVVESSYDFLLRTFPNLQMTGRIIFFLIGIITLCLASSFYITADLGVSTYDAISLIVANTWHIWKFRYCRIVSDVICVIIGTILYLLAGGKMSGLAAIVGVGTIVTAFFMGPLIEFFNVRIAQPFLQKGKDVS
ncbi:MAG: hypothetical protein PUD93_01150 [Lachnospiraceae bacterium]|nr:hypothetical protein [Lachnospiraceae bacterium]